jgi:acetyltransferase-like isoleucine patch superfamily enzyme
MLTSFLRGLRILRHPELVRRLGDLWQAEREIDAVRKGNAGAKVSSEAHVHGWAKGTLHLATGSQVEYGTIIALGDDHNGFGSLSVGEKTWIGPYNNIRLAGGTSITIGSGCLVSQFCTIVSANHDLSRNVRMSEAVPDASKGSIVIGDDVWLGAGAIILPGVTIADGAVIAAGAVVTRPVGTFEIWGGNPARLIGERPA